MRSFFVLICSVALVCAARAEKGKQQTSHAEHPAGGSAQHAQSPHRVALPGGRPPGVPSTGHPTGVPSTGHPTGVPSTGRPTRVGSPDHSQPQGSRPETAPAGNAVAKPTASAPPAPVYHYNFPTKSGLIGRDFTRPLTTEEQSAIAGQIANGQPTGTQARHVVAPAQTKVNPFPSRHFDLPNTPGPGIENVKFQPGGHIPGCESWRDSRYNMFRNYTAAWHDADWWRSHHSRIVFVLGGWYYWHAGYWLPAWGYHSEAVYGYDGPIYAYNNLEPDQVIANVQTALQELGYYHGPINGVLGSATRAALANYQRDHGLYSTSAIDEPTLAALGMA